MRRRTKFSDLYHLSQSYFDLPMRTITKKVKITLFNQTLKDIENKYREVGGYDMRYDDNKQVCRKSWEEVYNYLCFDRSETGD